MVNAWWEPLTFRLPAADGGQESWHRWIDTSRTSPEDIVPWVDAPTLDADTYTVGPRSIVVLIVGLSPAATATGDHQDPPAAGHG
jgi:glycogen operon protein